MDPAIIALFIPIFGIGIGGLAIYLSHVRKLAEIQARSGMLETSVGNSRATSAEVHAELQALRSEIEKLRDTSTRFDLSFDAGLTQLEERVARVENNATGSVGRTAVSAADRPDVLMARSR